MTGGQGQGFLGLAFLQQAAQKAGQHGLALRQGVKAGVGGMGVGEGLQAGSTACHALRDACVSTQSYQAAVHMFTRQESVAQVTVNQLKRNNADKSRKWRQAQFMVPVKPKSMLLHDVQRAGPRETEAGGMGPGRGGGGGLGSN